MHRIVLFILCCICLHSLRAETFTASRKTDTITPWQKIQFRVDKITTSNAFRMSYIGVPLIAGGLILSGEKNHFANLRNAYIPHFRNHYDDYLQYVPAVSMFALKASGVKGRSSWGRMLVSDAFSGILMGVAVNSIKYSTDVMRPDNTTRNSFPSGHTAMAFMTATMLHKEYGLTRSPWYSVGAYTIATTTAVSRMLNNKHWISDIMVGAGIGVLSTELGYFFADLIFKEKGLEHPLSPLAPISYDLKPSFVGYYMGFTLLPRQSVRIKNLELGFGTGSTAGFEGAWFINKYIGIGGRVLLSSSPLSIKKENGLSWKTNPVNIASIYIGSYFSYPLTKRWLIGSKVLIGSNHTARTDLSIENEDFLLPGERFEFEKTNNFGMGTGLSVMFLAERLLAVRIFADYTLQPFHNSVQSTDNGQYTSGNLHTILHAVTVGTSINVLLNKF